MARWQQLVGGKMRRSGNLETIQNSVAGIVCKHINELHSTARTVFLIAYSVEQRHRISTFWVKFFVFRSGLLQTAEQDRALVYIPLRYRLHERPARPSPYIPSLCMFTCLQGCRVNSIIGVLRSHHRSSLTKQQKMNNAPIIVPRHKGNVSCGYFLCYRAESLFFDILLLNITTYGFH